MLSYKEILKLSMPIMIGSAVQNLITLTDAFFLGRVGETEFAAIGLVGVFYLLITSIGYSFSKAGQIMIARRMGQRKEEEVGMITHNMMAFAMLLATLLFFMMKFGGDFIFSFSTDAIHKACVDYLDYRSYGVFFSYTGVIAVALYTGVARTTVIIYNALVMGVVNTIFNYGLIFGEWGFPEMGIAGAGLASTISEIVATSIFIIYAFWDKHAKNEYMIWKRPRIDVAIIKKQISLSIPIILQSVVGLGSWFVFFAIIESMGETPLAVSNMIRTIYLLFMIPSWGFASGVNTIVSNLIGQNQKEQVFKAVTKTAWLCFIFTVICASSLLLFPETVLQVNTDDPQLINGAKDLVGILFVILILFAFGSVYFNGLIGTGATYKALQLQLISVVAYLVYVILINKLLLHPEVVVLQIPVKIGATELTIPTLKLVYFQYQLYIAWFAEAIYWAVTLFLSIWYLKTDRWVGKGTLLFDEEEEYKIMKGE